MGLPEEAASKGLRFSWTPGQATDLDVEELARGVAKLKPSY
jgi:cysteine desulfurase